MESGIKRTQKDYMLAFKLAVVEQVEKGELAYKETQHRYGIQGRSTVLVWMRKHGRQSWGIRASSTAITGFTATRTCSRRRNSNCALQRASRFGWYPLSFDIIICRLIWGKASLRISE